MSVAGGQPYTIHGTLPSLHDATMVAMLTGWIDASGAAAAAMDHLIEVTGASLIVDFDPDTFIDYRARRPVMELREGVNTRIVWGTPQIRIGADGSGRPVVLLTGPEPDANWRLFADSVADLAMRMGVSRLIGLGAYPFGAPHTRPVGITATSPDPDVISRLDLSRTTMDVPAGVEAILEHAFADRRMPAMGAWAQVPHYVASMAYPAASARLLESLAEETGWTIDSSALRREAAIQRERLDHLVAANPEHAEMVSKLEAAFDALHPPDAPARAMDGDGSADAMAPIDAVIPSVEEIAAEVEQFLRDQQTGGQQ